MKQIKMFSVSKNGGVDAAPFYGPAINTSISYFFLSMNIGDGGREEIPPKI